MPLYRKWRWSTSSVPGLCAEVQRELEAAERMRCRLEEGGMEDQYAVDTMRPKCVELQRMCEQYKDLLRRRRSLLSQSHHLQHTIDTANQWCGQGVDLLASQPLEKCQTAQGAQESLVEINTYLRTFRHLRLSDPPAELKESFGDVLTSESRASVQQVLQRVEDVQAMCEKRRHSLRKMCRHPSPHHPAPSGQGAHHSSHPHSRHMDSSVHLRRKGSACDSPEKRSPKWPEKGVRRRTSDSQLTPTPTPTPALAPCHENNSSSSSSGVSSKTSSIAASDASSSCDVGDIHSSGGSSSRQRDSLSSASVGSLPETDVLQAKRRHVMNELVETEKTYVTELQEILWGYCKEMESRALQHLIPEELIGQKHILFGNLEQICKFHAETFLQELQECRDYPAKVGRCFVNRKEEFQMYSIYCQNKPKSEALRVRVGDSNPLFKECQRKLGHRLPLGAYLLKPVQRITKYQLLLKEMLRFTGEDQELDQQLQEALDTMLSVLQYLNAAMHQVHIVGYQENLLDLGRLLLHGGFSVWTEHKRERIKDLRFKPMQRHIFLYERGLLLCKKKEDANEEPIYTFKNKLKLSQVGLTEKLKGDKRKFELWSRGREEVFIIQAPTLQVKDVWVKEIKRVLMNQFDQIRNHHKMCVPMSQDESPMSSQISSDSSDYSLDNWRSGGGGGGGTPTPTPTPTTLPSSATATTPTATTTPYNIINNNHSSTLPMGLEMISPLTPPSSSAFPPSPHSGSRGPGDGVRGRGLEVGSEDQWSSGELSSHEEEEGFEHRGALPAVEPSYRQPFVSLGDHDPVDPSELSMAEGDVVQVLRVGGHGWWYARLLSTGREGWVPSTFLHPALPPPTGAAAPASGTNSSSDSLSTPGKREMSLSHSSLGSPYLSSPVSETTV